MKKILVILISLLITSSAYADACGESLIPTFTSEEANKLCATFPISSVSTSSLLPDDDNTLDLGSAVASWRSLYLDTSIISAGGQIIQVDADAQRLFNFHASSDTALTMTFGDAGVTATQGLTIQPSTTDADDDATLQVGFASGTRGAGITLPGEEVAGGSDITYNAGTSDTHIFKVAGTTEITLADDALTFAGAAATLAFGATSGTVSVNGTAEAVFTPTALTPGAVAGNALGTAALPWYQVLTGKIAIDADVTGVTGSNVGVTAAQNFNSDSGGIAVIGYGANTDGARIQTFKTRATTTDANTVVTNGDELLNITVYAADGDSYSRAAAIVVTNSAAPGDGDMPGTIDFQTSPDGSATPASVLSLSHAKAALFTGTVRSSATADIGWSVVAGANTACNTTCTSACVVGQDTGTANIFVGCADATADVCLCAGAS